MDSLFACPQAGLIRGAAARASAWLFARHSLRSLTLAATQPAGMAMLRWAAALALAGTPAVRAASVLVPGDIAFVGYSTVDPDRFAFVALVNIDAGVAIGFTDSGWSNGVFVTSEQTGVWTAPAAGLPRGSVVEVEGSTVTGGGSWSGSALTGLSMSGDQILAFQGSEATPSFIAGISSTDWRTTGAVDSNRSHLPPALALGATAVGFAIEIDNGAYTGGKVDGSRMGLLTAINNPAAWTRSEPGAPAAPAALIVRPSTPELPAGAIAFVAYSTDSNAFAFAALQRLPAGTEIAFTDIGWDGVDLAPESELLYEETGVWTAPAAGVSVGKVIRIEGTNVLGGGAMSGALSSLSVAGDQILAFQGSVTHPAFIAGVSSCNWRGSGAVDKNSSYLPAGLTLGGTAVGWGNVNVDNGYYTGSTTAATFAAIRSLINDPALWTRSDSAQTWPVTWRFISDEITGTVFYLH